MSKKSCANCVGALKLAGLRELIRRRPPAAAVRPFYSNFDWLDYGLI
jgi:hypothetical protein